MEAFSSTNAFLNSAETVVSSTPALGPGEVLRKSGKYAKPTKVPGKNYCKDEVVIRNSDSGKGKGFKISLLIIFYI